MKIMKINTLFAVACAALVVLGAGCVGTNDGHSQTGVPWAKDTIDARYPRPVERVASAARVVLKRKGKLLVDNSVNNTFVAKVNERTVYVSVTKIDEKITAVQVQVRSGAGGDIYLASEIDKEIALDLTVNP
jgi:Protein of unknown function (DUF3568)